MKQKPFDKFLSFQFNNRKSKTCTEPRRSIENLQPDPPEADPPCIVAGADPPQAEKWLGLVAIAVTFVMCVAVADAQLTKEPRIGVLGAPEEPRFSEIVGGLKKGLGDLGYSLKTGQILEVKVARADESAAKSIVEDLLRQRAQVLFLIGSRLLKPAREASADAPIVFITPGDPVAAGLVSSLARPGRNMTGMTFEYPELSGKRLELVKEIVPRAQRVLVIYDPRDPSPMQGLAAAREAAPKLRVTLVERQAKSREEITKALEALGRADALLAIPGGFPSGHYEEMIRAAGAKRRATMFNARTGSTMGALASYGANDADIARQAARLVDKILNGANAGELPVERPTKLEFVINLKTAKEIGLTIPPNVLVRADKVIK
jgi:putative ABC transport system substrate-binding protein